MSEHMTNQGYSLKATKPDPTQDNEDFGTWWERRKVEEEEDRKASLARLKAAMPEGHYAVGEYHGGHDEGWLESMTLFDAEDNQVEWPKGQCAEVEETREVYTRDDADNRLTQVWTRMVPKDLESLFEEAAYDCLGEIYGSFAFEGNCHGEISFRDGKMSMDGHTSYEQYEPERHEWQ